MKLRIEWTGERRKLACYKAQMGGIDPAKMQLRAD
jgi:hypothetical protein